MRRLSRSTAGAFCVAPRWPYRSVLLSEAALTRLEDAQKRLAPLSIQLLLTRGYEEPGPVNRLHGVARWVGAGLFRLLYRTRADESVAIFSPNGHDHGGDAIDVAILDHGKRLVFLPWGVFTPSRTLRAKRRRHETVIAAVWAALTEAGFRIHPNPTEALQIHCDLNRDAASLHHSCGARARFPRGPRERSHRGASLD